MRFFELEATDISSLSDGDLRELVARLCEAELITCGLSPTLVMWGGAQEAPDGGLDVRIQDASGISGLHFLPRANTGFQVKKHAISKAACKKEMQEDGQSKKVIEDLASQNGAYIIVSGATDCTDKMLADRLDGMKEAVASLSDKEQLYLGFYGRDRLCVWLRQHPGVSLWVRSRLGKPLAGWRPFGRWAATPLNQTDDFLLDDHPCITDTSANSRDPQSVVAGIQLVRNKLQQPSSVVRLVGLSGVGKTRFAQALFEPEVGRSPLPKSEAIYADLGEDLTPTASAMLDYLIANQFSCYLILDNCPPDTHRQLQKKVTSANAKLRLLTIEYDISDDKPEETDVIQLEPSSEATVSKLLQRRYPTLGQINADRIAEFSGGNARVALALAGRVETDETLSNFSDQDLFERLFAQRRGDSSDLLKCAEALSLVYSFNVSRNAHLGDELKAIGEISGLQRQDLYRNQAELLRRQLAQQRGDWRAILPHALANRLAKKALQNLQIEDINAELFKPENIRLFQSCAHRLGYLHDFQNARDLAISWFVANAPLADISQCSDQELTVLMHVAPVFPEVVLAAIEAAAKIPGFASRSNQNFSLFSKLLCQLAYDDGMFDRAAKLLLQFSYTEKAGENRCSIVQQLKQLFSLHLSGTHASPERRQAFIKRLISTDDSRHQEIAKELLKTAFMTQHWRGFGPFHFGARLRTEGWVPQTANDRTSWYLGFIQLLEPVLRAPLKQKKEWAQALLASHFRGLWSIAPAVCNLLEKIIVAHGLGGQWPDIWISIKTTLRFDKEKFTPQLLQKIESLEKQTAPQNLLAEIRSFAFVDVWGHIDIQEVDYQRAVDALTVKVINLGRLAAVELSSLTELGCEIWQTRSHLCMPFGEGLAKVSSTERLQVFDRLIASFIEHGDGRSIPEVIAGFLKGAHAEEPEQAQLMLERILEIPPLKPFIVYFITKVPLTPWSLATLQQLAGNKELEAWRFDQLAYGRVHENISDQKFARLLFAILDMDKGYLTAINLLDMRLYETTQHNYSPDAAIREVARKTIQKYVMECEDSSDQVQDYQLEKVVQVGFNACTPVDDVKNLIALLCERIEARYFISNDMNPICSGIITTHPELLLEAVFENGENGLRFARALFRDSFRQKPASLNEAPLNRILAWCGSDESRIQKVAAALHSYRPIDVNPSDENHAHNIVLSDHIRALLAVASDKQAIVEIIFNDTSTDSWSGSRANILETRAKAFHTLLEYPDGKVRELAQEKASILETIIQSEREREANEDRNIEQRFE